MNLQNPQCGGSCRVLETRSSSQHLNAQNAPNSFMASAHQNTHPQFSSFEKITTQQGPYDNMNIHQGLFENMNIYQGSYPSGNAQQSPQKSLYHLNAQQEAYGNSNDLHSAYHFRKQQGAFQH